MGGLAGCRGGGGHLSLVVLVSEKPNSVSEKSGKSQGILFICGAGNPERAATSVDRHKYFPRATHWPLKITSEEQHLSRATKIYVAAVMLLYRG